MNKTFKRVVSTILVACMMLTACLSLASCGEDLSGQYTYKTYSTALGTNWNPHTWENSADDSILSYISSPFVTMEAKDTENGVYQWVYEMATSIKDVTATHQGDLTKYAVTLPAGKTAEEVESGYVFEIKLNPDAAWENGEKINADDYIYSMQQLLNPQMKNYRANLYIAGESALAGGEGYYYQGSKVWLDAFGGYAIADLVKGADGVYAAADGTPIKIAPKASLDWLGGYALETYVNAYGEAYFGVEAFQSLIALCDEEGYVTLTDESLGYLVGTITAVAAWGETAEDACNYLVYQKEFPVVDYDKVGCYKVDDYTINYVCQTAIDYNYFLTSCTSTWLVYEELYEAGKDTTGDLVTTNYGTSKETSMSYGVYKFQSFQEEKQIVFVQNENWYGWERDDAGELVRDEEGNLVSYTDYHKNTNGEDFKVDGEVLRQHQITKVVIDVMDEAAAKQAFLKGDLSDWSPSADELSTFAASDRLYKVDETYTMSFFFNTNVDDLKEMDKSKGNTNSVVLSNINFRKAFSLAIDRAEYVTATEGYKPAFALMNSLYYYDFYNDPTSSYRNTNQAMEAICNLYGVKWGEGTPYATLKDACDSITGYNLTEAKALMKKACDELVAAGLYTAGQEIKIQIAWSAGAIESAGQKQITLMNNYINAAIEGSGFGKITLEGIGSLSDRYSDVPNGNYAIGYGAWGGAALYPFRNFQVYMDPDQYDINEAACWDPKTETVTLTIDGKEVTKTWQEWSNSMMGTGEYANADNETKLTITSMLETKYLQKYYRIPLAGTTICSMLSYQLNYYTEEYNMAYGFGGSRLMTFQYDDQEWKDYVKSNKGKLSYE